MNSVFKYEVPIEDRFKLMLPKHAKILSFQAQHERPQIWALVDPEEEAMEREFRLAGTGHPIDERDVNLYYIGTCQMRDGGLVWHLFEIFRF
jgi:hypothetical protein